MIRTQASWRSPADNETISNNPRRPPMKPSICFVAPNAYSLLSGRRDLNHIGGAELQQVLLARELSSREYRVCFVTVDCGQADGQPLNGIPVYKTCGKEDGWRILRFVHPRWTSLASALRRSDCDIYYQRNADYVTAQVALWCRWNRRRFVFATANDSDCLASVPIMESRVERGLYRWGLRRADAVVAQTAAQQRLLRENFGIEAAIVPNCCPRSGEDSPAAPPPGAAGRPHILWAARFAEEKRMDWLLDVAERCPRMVFDLVGAGKSEYAARIVRRAAAIPNVVMHGHVPHEDMPRFYRQAALLCCTSLYEGFPNTFLEAWSLGLPVVSTFDPDGVIVRYGVGWVSDTVDGVAEQLERALASPAEWRAASTAARRYCRENHSPEASASRLEQILSGLASGSRPLRTHEQNA
jgi:glycosyltransferase involved in cell wall biosynthesis